MTERLCFEDWNHLFEISRLRDDETSKRAQRSGMGTPRYRDLVTSRFRKKIFFFMKICSCQNFYISLRSISGDALQGLVVISKSRNLEEMISILKIKPFCHLNLTFWKKMKIFCIFFRKYLVMSEKSSIFASFFVWTVPTCAHVYRKKQGTFINKIN